MCCVRWSLLFGKVFAGKVGTGHDSAQYSAIPLPYPTFIKVRNSTVVNDNVCLFLLALVSPYVTCFIFQGIIMKDSLCVGIVAEGRRISCDRYSDHYRQFSGSVTFWYGSGFADRYRPFIDPDPALFFIGFQQK